MTERARQLRTDELYAQKKKEPFTVIQLLSQIRTMQHKVNALNEEKQQAALECPTFLVSPREFRVPFWIAALCTELDGYFRKRFLQVYLIKKRRLRRFPGIQRRIWQIRLAKVCQELP